MNQVLLFVLFASTCASLVGDFGDTRITSIGWAVPLLVSAAGLAVRFSAPSGRLVLWLPWILFIFATAVASHHAGAVHRTAIMATPFLVGSLAASLNVTSRDILRFVRLLILFAFLATAILAAKALLGPSGRMFFLAAESQTMVLLAWVLLHVHLTYRLRSSLLAWVLVLAVPVLSVARAATLAALSCLVLTLAPVGARFRVTALLATTAIAFGIAFIPAFQEKTFLEAVDLLSAAQQPEAIQTSGRLVAWSILADRIPDAPFFGHGSNSSQSVLRSQIDAFDHPHNDWLRLVFDYGVFGLALFLATALTQIWLLLRMGRHAVSREGKFASYVAASLFVPFFMLMVTDNVLLFAAYFGNIHFLLIGYAYSIHRAEVRVAVGQTREGGASDAPGHAPSTT